MNFNEKLQSLRLQKGLTQQELARELYVSRTAVSKWESGRGYPNIDSLKQIARFFSLTVDELLSTDQILTLAEEEKKKAKSNLCDLAFGLFDFSVALLLFIPLFGEEAGGFIQSVSLLRLTGVANWLKILFFIAVVGNSLFGVLTLALQGCDAFFWQKNKRKFSLTVNSLAVVLFIISSQPYAATALFILLSIKSLMLIKKV